MFPERLSLWTSAGCRQWEALEHRKEKWVISSLLSSYFDAVSYLSQLKKKSRLSKERFYSKELLQGLMKGQSQYNDKIYNVSRVRQNGFSFIERNKQARGP